MKKQKTESGKMGNQETGSQKRVLVGLSGGVDSAVAALLLKKQGFKVIGAFMRNFSENKNNLTGECNWVADKKDAQKIAAILEIPFVVLNFEKEYKRDVIDPMFDSYRKGLTPNPDAFCNKFIKFPLLWREARKLGVDYIATGHYIVNRKSKEGYVLEVPKDKKKDQSYFLYELSQKDLEHSLFPLGGLTKEEVRKIAEKNGFPNFNKRGSRGICFVGKIDMKEFLKQKIKPRAGKVVSPDGEVVGEHKGVMYFTIGERVGEDLAKVENEFRNKNGKIYVAGKDTKKNILIVAGEGDKSLARDKFFIERVNWITGRPLKFPLSVKVRIRHLGELISARVAYRGGKYICELSKGLSGVAEGQSAVLYSGKKVLGGGEIRF